MGGDRSNSIAVVLAAILVVSAITTPVLASGIGNSSRDLSKQDPATVTVLDDVSSSQPEGHGPPGHGPPGNNRAQGPSNVSVPDIPTNNSVQSLVLARDRALGLAAEHDSSASAFERIADLINESIEEYRQFDRIDSRAAFETGIRAQRALSKLAKHSDEDAIENVSKPLFEAYNRSSRIAVLDASHAVAVYESEFRNPGQRQRVESYLGNAADALDRADQALGKSSHRRGPPSHAKHSIKRRVQALTQLRNGWKHASRTLDATEANTQPTLTLSHRRAFEHNGTAVVPLRVTVRDIGPSSTTTRLSTHLIVITVSLFRVDRTM